jgi:2-phosphosulfolactate phosphatase
LAVDVYSQEPFECRLQWGPEGARLAAQEGHIVVIVDVLVFSTSTIAAVMQGAQVLPVGSIDEANQAEERWSAVKLFGRATPTPEGWSHSPVSLKGLPEGIRLVYYSLNGSTCCAAGQGATAVFAGGLVNATAVARAAEAVQRETGRPITVVSCGERWEGGNRGLRPALEDELGAGAILGALTGTKSAEATAAETLFLAQRERLAALLWDCASGRELRARAYEGDVEFASQVDRFNVVPALDPDGWLRRWE